LDAQRPHFAPGLQVVQAYGSGGFTVSGVRYPGSILVLPERVLPWSVDGPDELELATLQVIRAAQPVPDILVVGLGASFVPFPPELRQAIRAWGPVVEAMATASACRTYNVLLADQRRVAAALIRLPPD
jgi:uncharacterized protein (TIGR04206 family)